MKKIIHSFIITLCSALLLSCASTQESAQTGTRKVLSRLENDLLYEPPKWVKIIDIEDNVRREKEIKEFFPELNDTIVFTTKTTNPNIHIADINAKNNALTEYKNCLEKAIYEGIKDKDIKNIIAFLEEKNNMKGTSLNEEELKIKFAKKFATDAYVNGLMPKKSFWIKYDFIDNQSGKVVSSSYDIYKIFYVENSIFNQKVNQYVYLIENENIKAVKSLENLRKQRLEEERLRKEAEEKAKLEEERLKKEAEDKAKLEEDRLKKEAENKAFLEQLAIDDEKVKDEVMEEKPINNNFNIIETTSSIETNTQKEDSHSSFE